MSIWYYEMSLFHFVRRVWYKTKLQENKMAVQTPGGEKPELKVTCNFLVHLQSAC